MADIAPPAAAGAHAGTRRGRLAELGLVLPRAHQPHDPLISVVMHNGIASTSGQLPRIDGRITCFGHLGSTVTVEAGVEAARNCALSALAVLELALGSLDRIERLVRVTGFVACAPGFTQQHVVIDGASRALFDVFGEAGRHVRSAIGVAALPHGAAVELELTATFS